MFDLTNLLIAKAYAQVPAAPAVAPAATDVAAASGDSLMRFMPLFLIFMVFYFFLIRPQQKKADQQAAMIKALKKGDKIVTSGGIVGTVTKVDDEAYVMVEIAKDVQIKVVRSTISNLVEDLAKAKDKPSKEK